VPTRQSRLVLGQRPASDPVYLAAALSVALPGQASRAGPRSNGQRRCWTTPPHKTRDCASPTAQDAAARGRWVPLSIEPLPLATNQSH